MPTRATWALLRLNLVLLCAAFLVPLGVGGLAMNVPGDAANSEELPTHLHLHWVRELSPLKPAWPDQPRLRFDEAYVPVIHQHMLFVASSRTDSVTAYDPATGEERWRFLADGPVRFAPIGWRDQLFFVADDGRLYCLDSVTGTLLWKFRGGPSGQRLLGNERLVSMWPARGAPVVADGVVYFAAGIWPFMGTFLHALDARTGRVIWTNDGDGSIYIKQPHQTDAFAGVAPQGHLVVAEDRLLVPGGRSAPACYDRHTGKLLHYRLADNSKRGGGPDVVVRGDLLFNGGSAFDLTSGDYLCTLGEPLVLADDRAYVCSGTEVRAYDLQELRSVERPVRRISRTTGRPLPLRTWAPERLTTTPTPPIDTAIRAGSRLIAGGAGRVFALRLPLADGGPAPMTWSATIDGRPARLVAADGKLYVSTREGRLYCFGAGKIATVTHRLPATSRQSAESATATSAKSILDSANVRDGHAVVFGAGDSALVAELARQSALHVIAVEEDTEKAEQMRQELIAAGLYGTRTAVVVAESAAANLPPYLATLIVVENVPEGEDDRKTLLRQLYQSLRPYGGTMIIPAEHCSRELAGQIVATDERADAKIRMDGNRLHIVRQGPLPGAGEWTHEHADAANTRVSLDDRVKAPLGLLWFGGPPHDGILPRHGHGPQPQVSDGRLIIEGVDKLRAIDIYTGRLLWEASLPGVGKFYDNLAHQPGANAGGSNYATASDGVYVAYGKSCLRLDPATGQRLAAFPLPAKLDSDGKAYWSFVRVAGEYLIGGVAFPLTAAQVKRKGPLSSSRHLAVLNRATGKPLWHATAKEGFRNNAICSGGGRLYAIDRPSLDLFSFTKKLPLAGASRLLAYDLANGKEVWRAERDVFGTWLSYSEKQDVLLEAGWVGRDALFDEPKGVRAYRAAAGKEIWFQPSYIGPAIIHGDRVLTGTRACDLLTGRPVDTEDPLTGTSIPWTWTRTYGCNMPMASKHLLTFRSGAAGYFDLCQDGGTGNFGGFRSGCTNNLVVAGGVLCAPDYTRTCTCSYQNQTSLALVPMPDAEIWTFFGKRIIDGPVRRVGINLGAPGNRKADDGTLWLEFPSVGGPSPRLPIRTVPAQPEWFRHHASRVQGPLPWVAASGARGLRKLTIPLADRDAGERLYTVRLCFAEPDGLEPGRRIFHVAIQGRQVLTDFDISQEAGGPMTSIVREFKGIAVTDQLTITLTPTAGDHTGAPVLCGVEVVQEQADGK